MIKKLYASHQEIKATLKKFRNVKINICMLHGGHLQICFLELPMYTVTLVV
jgi:hypothetical protein